MTNLLKLWKVILREDFLDYKIAKKEFAKYLASGKKSVDLKDLAEELGIKLHHYK